jgi:thymidylate kinase
MLMGRGEHMEELQIVRKLLDNFEQEEIRYCHWKSNEHVKEGMCGITDLDILVDRDQCSRVNEILFRCGFKRFVATFGIRYQAIEDFIGIDESTGKMVHCHLHYQLTLGEKYLKGYRLPWETIILNTRVWNQDASIYVSNPDIELILLTVRAALKWRFRDRLFSLFGKNYFRGDFKREYEWLHERINMTSSTKYSDLLLGEDASLNYQRLIHEDFTMKYFLSFRKDIKKSFRWYRTYGVPGGILMKQIKELVWLASVFGKRYLGLHHALRRTLPSGGIVVAFVGSDGSGKSTVVKKLVKQLSWKIDVMQTYFGSGDGPSSFWRFPLKMVRKLLLRTSKNPSVSLTEKVTSSNEKLRLRLLNLAKPIWALTLAIEKKKKINRIWGSKNAGLVIITDRYPQSQIKGMNDGPLLNRWMDHKSKLLRWLANKELQVYQFADKNAPDLVIRLNVTPEVAAARKNDMTLEELDRRIEAVKSLQFATTVIDVDATKPLEEVMVEVTNVIWKKI